MSDTPWIPPDAPGPPPAAGVPTFRPPPQPQPWQPSPFPPSSGQGPRRRRPWAVIVAVGCVLLVVLLALASTLLVPSDETETADDDVLVPIGPSGAPGDIAELPPSERGELPATTVPQVVDEQDLSSEAARSGALFAELTCQFTGTSMLEQPLSTESFGAASPNRMNLEPGARFDCTDGTEASAGALELDAAFESLSAFSGLGSGTGRITWSELPPARQVPGALAPTSTTGVEVQLEFPVIVVWTTILDGPYAGYRGRLVLRDWEPIPDASGAIIGTRFATTATTFSPG